MIGLARWRGPLTAALLAALVACGGGNGSGNVGEDPAPNVPAPPADPVAQDFKLAPQRLGMTIGTDGAVLAVASPGAVTWASSDVAVATVDATGLVHAVAKGRATISATSGTTVVTSAVTVYDTTGATPDANTDALIAQALAANTINAEQALTYRIFALFGDDRLPAQFVGAPAPGPDHLLLRELWTTVASLSPATQDLLRPFVVPPIYANSWFAQRLGLASRPAAAAASRARALAAGGRSRTTAETVNCEAQRIPDAFTRVSTAHFNIFYVKSLDAAENDASAAMVSLIAAVAEEAYAANTALLGRFPIADTAENCNGGDGAVDLYYGGFALFGLGAWTNGYPPPPGGNACANRPSYVMLNSLSVEFMGIRRSLTDGRPLAKSILAHELLHVLQFAMDRQASCKDVEWFDEATAQWAMDHVVPSIGAGLPGEFGAESGLGSVASNYRKSGPVLAEYLFAGHMVSIEKTGDAPKLNGYSDYLFFQFLARTQTPATIKRIFDAMGSGLNSVEAIGAVVDMKAVWPEFAKSLWIGEDQQVLDYWATQDEYRFGLDKVYAQVPTTGIPARLKEKLKSLKVDQAGQRREKFELLKNAKEFEGYLIHPRSVFYEHFKFTDPTVHSVYLFNPIAVFPNAEFIKVQALRKIGGVWKDAEDWTKEPFKQFCLDKKDERLEELILIVSNSETNRATEKPFAIPLTVPMQLSTSNVGCWKWQGSATTVTTGSVPFASQSTSRGANMVFEVSSVLPGRIVFLSTGGVVSGSSTTAQGQCTITSLATSRPAVAQPVPDGTIDLNLDLDLGFGGIGGEGPDRKFLAFSGLSTLSTYNTEVCPAFTLSSTYDSSWDWLHVDVPNQYQVSDDGQTIEGRFTASPLGVATIDSIWKFTAMRE